MKASQEEKIKGDKTLTEQQKKLLLDFAMSMKARQLSERRVEKNLWHIRNLISLGFSIIKISQKNVEKVMADIHKKEWSSWTKHDYKANLKKFIAFRLGKGYNPKDWSWIRIRLSKKDRPMIAEGDLLTPEEVEALIKSAVSTRDKALLSLLYESGARPSEILTLKIKDVKLDMHGALINIRESKTIQRPVRVVNCVPYVISWLNIHPIKNNVGSPVWISTQSNLSEPKIISINSLHKIMKNAARRSGIRNGRRIYPYLMRHSRITHLLRNPKYPQAIIKRIVGWTDDSEQISTYLHMSNETVDKLVLEAEGKLNESYDNVKTNIDRPALITPFDDLFRRLIPVLPELKQLADNPELLQRLRTKTNARKILKRGE